MDSAQMVEIELWPCLYRIRCTATDCRNLARVIVRRVAEGGGRLGRASCAKRLALQPVRLGRDYPVWWDCT